MTLEVTARVDGRTVYNSWALNEVTVEKASRERMIELTVEIDGRPLSTWGCDGVVMATPTGSTAYALSANGPILHPSLPGIVLAPVAPQSLSNRPIVLPDSCCVSIRVTEARDALVNCDMQNFAALEAGDRLLVQCAPYRTEFLHPPGWSYYATLRGKLNWHAMPAGHDRRRRTTDGLDDEPPAP